MFLPRSLSISCVTYASNEAVLLNTLNSLAVACAYARSLGELANTSLTLIDNGPDYKNLELIQQLAERYSTNFDSIHIKTGHGNLGYGRGHNLTIHETASEYHLVLNPDVVLDKTSLAIALTYMAENADVGLLAPDARGENGERQYIAKRQPTFSVLLARALNRPWLNRRLKKQLEYYECRDLIPAKKPVEVELASGCFMFFRTSILQRVGGFNPIFFMYFEDFDLSLRVSNKSKIMHHPKIAIVHLGGSATKKNFRRICYFVKAMLQFKCSMARKS